MADRPPPAGLLELEQLLEDYLDTPVQVTLGAGRGRIAIAFATLEDLERIYRLIAGSSTTD
jgi:ParB family chromosome partitioning protein